MYDLYMISLDNDVFGDLLYKSHRMLKMYSKYDNMNEKDMNGALNVLISM